MTLALFVLCACASSGPAPQEEMAAAEVARLERDARSLNDRQAILQRELERITSELAAWSKRHDVGVPTSQLALSLLSRSLDAHHGSTAEDRSEFEREYAEIEHAMARALSERAALDRDAADLEARLSRFTPDGDPITRSQTYHFGDVFFPIPDIAPYAARKPCDLMILGSRGRICSLVHEECKAIDKRRPTLGWDQTCSYVCRNVDIIRHL